MITIRPGDERGRTQTDWLDSRHTFSFDSYYDPAHTGFRSLRVLNEDRVAPGKGFGMHPHRDMEILTYVLEGALEHRDSTGGRGILRPGELQHMSAGTGVTHSEFNPSSSEPAHFLQIWIVPERRGLRPEYEQHAFAPAEWRGEFIRLAGRSAPAAIHQDASLYAALLEPEQRVQFFLALGRHAWVQVVRGSVNLNGLPLAAGDGAAASDEKLLAFQSPKKSEILLFDVA